VKDALDTEFLSIISDNLNQASDALSASIADFESKLNDLRLGTTVWVTFVFEEQGSGSGPPAECCGEIGYGKHSGRWGLLYRRGSPEFEYEEVMFLTDAPRTEKLRAIEQLPELVSKLETEAYELYKRIKGTIEKMGSPVLLHHFEIAE